LSGVGPEPEQGERLARLADQLGCPWLAHLTRALLELTPGGTGDGAARFRAYAEANGDRWGAALADLLGGLGALWRGGDAPDALEHAASELHDLGAGVLAAWCLAAAAGARARAGDPEALHAALQAEAVARAAG